ncbi:TonB-dependent receptor [Thermaurantiacus sp.]
MMTQHAKAGRPETLLGASRIALVAGLVGLAPGALAQGAPAAEEATETIIVTGFKAALITAAEDKKLSDLVIESVTAEDIGKLPDQSIAEAISRLPGLTTQRLDGRAQVITIRGLAPDFSTTLLNGREQVTTGDNRGVEYDQYPAEIVSRVDVFKTADASLIGQGLSGTVDVRTMRPLDYDRPVITVNAIGEWLSNGKLNAGSDSMGYRVTGTYADQFLDDRLGISIAVAHSSSPTQIERFNAWGYPDGAPGGARVIGGSKPYAISTDLDRTAVVGTLQYEPSANFSTTLDIFYSKFKDDQVKRGIEFPLFWSAASLQPGFTVEDGLVTNGAFDGVKGVVRNDANRRDSDLWAVGWNAKAGNDVMRAMLDVSYSGVTREDLILETYAGTGRGPVGQTDRLGFTMVDRGAVFAPSRVDYADFSRIFLTSPQGWGGDIVPGGQDGYYNNRSIKDEIIAARLEFENDLGGRFLRSVQYGMNYSFRTKRLTPDEFFLQLKANTDGKTSVPVPNEFRLGTTALDFLGVPGMISYDPIALLNSGIYNLVRNPNADVNTKAWEVDENVLTGYVKFNIDSELSFARLTGNFGVQMVQTDQSSDGLASSGTGAGVSNTPVSDGDSYFVFLPTANLAFRFPEDLVVRFAVGRQLARARMDDMRASINYNYNASLAGSTDPFNSPWSGSGGNPRLRPWLATSVDLSVEKYFGPAAYIAVAGFYKNLESYIYNQSVFYDFTGFPTGGGPEPALRTGLVSTPQNGEGGNIYGVEVSGTWPIADTGFGVTGSYSFTDSNIQPDPGNPAQPLPGLSKHVASGTAWYEKAGFSARASVRYRSEFLGEIRAFGGGNERRLAAGEVLLDAQIGYEFEEGPLRGLAFTLQGYNLTNEPFFTFVNEDERQVQDYESYGRRLMFGVRYRF